MDPKFDENAARYGLDGTVLLARARSFQIWALLVGLLWIVSTVVSLGPIVVIGLGSGALLLSGLALHRSLQGRRVSGRG